MKYGEMTFDELKKALRESIIELDKKKKEFKDAKKYVSNWQKIKAELQNELSESKEKLNTKQPYKKKTTLENRIKEIEELLLNNKGLEEKKERLKELKQELFSSFSGYKETIPERISALKTELKKGPKSSEDIFNNKKKSLQEEFERLTDEKERKEKALRSGIDDKFSKSLKKEILEIEKKISEIDTDTYDKETNKLDRGKYSSAKKDLSDKRKEARESIFGEAEEGVASIAVGLKALSLSRKFAFTKNQKERIRDKYAYYIEQSEKQIKRIALNRISPDFIKKKKIKSLSESRKQAKQGLEETTIEAEQENFLDKFFDFGRNFAVDDRYVGLSVDEIIHKIEPSPAELEDDPLIKNKSSEETAILKYNIYESDALGRIETIKSTSEELLKNKNIQENNIKTTKEAKNFTELVSETSKLKSTAVVLNPNEKGNTNNSNEHGKQIKSIAESQKQISENTKRQADSLEKISDDFIDEQDTKIKGVRKEEKEKEQHIGLIKDKKKKDDDSTIGLGILGTGIHMALMGMIPALGTALLATLKKGIGTLVTTLAKSLLTAAPWLVGVTSAAALGYAAGSVINEYLLSDSTKESIGDVVGFAVDNVLSFFGNEDASERLNINANKDAILSGIVDNIPEYVGKDIAEDENMLKDFDKISKTKNEIIDLEEARANTINNDEKQIIEKKIIEKQEIIKEALSCLNLPPEVNKESNMINIETDYNKAINETVMYDIRTTVGSPTVSAQAIGINSFNKSENAATNSFELFNK